MPETLLESMILDVITVRNPLLRKLLGVLVYAKMDKILERSAGWRAPNLSGRGNGTDLGPRMTRNRLRNNSARSAFVIPSLL